ncbi:MAG: hypothetical protein ACREXV_06225 [Polaromonas sp.]
MMTTATGWKREEWKEAMLRELCYYVVIASVIVFALGTPAPAPAQDTEPDRKATSVPAQDAEPDRKATPAPAQGAAPDRKATSARTPERDAVADRHTPAPRQDAAEPDHFRGVVITVDASSIVVKTRDGKTVRLRLSDNLTIISLTKGSYTAVDFGVYVGAVAVRLDEYSPIVRDSLSWLHKGFELRIIDEQLRGIAVGHKKWDLTPDSIIAHGWIDDIEGRVVSIKWGPTELEETDVETPRDAPVLKMSLGDKSLIKPNANVFAGAQKGANGEHMVVFIFVGNDGIVPPL